MRKELRKRLEQEQKGMRKDWEALRQIPESGWDLPRTTAFLQQELEKMEVEWSLFQSKALVAQIGSGPAILLRAEMDAMPVQERSSLTGRSHTSVRHYSGHDLHMAMLLGIARTLKAYEQELPGRVTLLFYPAGESGAGARFLVERGFLEAYPVQTVLALHLNPTFPLGMLSYRPGQVTAYLDAFSIQIQGQGGRGYAPHKTVNPLEIAAHIQILLNSLIQRELPPDERAVLSIGRSGGGTILNQIPDRASVEGTFRCPSETSRQYLHIRTEEICQGLCSAYRGSCSIEYVSTPAVYNTPALYEKILPALQDRFEGALDCGCVTLGADDLCYLSQYVPTAFFILGSGEPAGNYDESLLFTGASLLLEALLALWS
jgi:hippurate hydrolase